MTLLFVPFQPAVLGGASSLFTYLTKSWRSPGSLTGKGGSYEGTLIPVALPAAWRPGVPVAESAPWARRTPKAGGPHLPGLALQPSLPSSGDRSQRR